MMKQTTLPIPTAPSYAMEDFVVSPCNQLAWQWLQQWPNWPSYGAIILGPEASGKTHLLQCWRSTAKARLLHPDAEIPQALAALPDAHIAIDNAQTWCDAANQAKLFHLLNHTKEQQRSILLTATTAPCDWPITLKDLRSRLLSLPVWQLGAPDDALLAAILSKHFSDRQLLVERHVLDYMIARSERSFKAIKNMASGVDQLALQSQRPVTTALVRQWLELPPS